MLERLRLILNALERFLRRIVRTQFDELVFVIAYILLLMGLCLVGLWAAGKVGIFLAACFGLVPFALCGFILRRMPPCSAKEVRRRLPGDFVGAGVLFLAFYVMGFFAAQFAPIFHPVHGEMWFQFSLLFAAAPGFIMVGLAGHVDPRICFAVNPATRGLSLPWWTRAAGSMLLYGGFVLGAGVMYWVHHAAA